MRGILGVGMVVALLVLAGCSGSGGQPSESGLPSVSQDPNAQTGSIRGVVVDDSLRTIASATVAVAGSPLTTQTDENGAFVFTNLAPSTYFLTANKTGFIPSQTSADVVRGGVTDARLQLRPDLSPSPYHVTEVDFDGYMEAWTGIAQFFIEDITNNTSLCTCYAYFTPGPNVRTLVFEAYWEPNVPSPSDDQFYGLLHVEGGEFWESIYCDSPCVMHIDAISAHWKPGEEIEVLLNGPDAGIAFEQQFEMYVTAFYNEPAPAGWTLLEDGP